MKIIKNQSGITLVALVVTIIVLMILASISIGAVFSEKGIIQQAKDSKKQHEDMVKAEEENLNDLLGEYRNSMDGSGFTNETGGGDNEGNNPTPTPNDETKGPNGKPLPGTITEIVDDTTQIEDKNGNPIEIPGGFKVAEDSGSTVEEGIVVEDGEGNQFVWIPVSNINHDGSNKIKKSDGTEVEITLGRYTFDKTTGDETIVQCASEYENNVKIDSTRYEDHIARIATSTSSTTTAKNLRNFVEGVNASNGFYFARYEASFAGGTEVGMGADKDYRRPASKISSTTNSTSVAYVKGRLWNGCGQREAAQASKQMYYENNYVESDLVNSYMWDTVVVYIQEMGYNNYANQSALFTTIKNTGLTGDEKCKIFDMAGNCIEWTTESSSNNSYPCISRGGNYNVPSHTVINRSGSINNPYMEHCFRVGLWIKSTTTE